jgi:hypothetical protein
MTEKQIQLLGFEANYDDGNGNWDKYHYYTYYVGGLELQSNASDEVKPNSSEWYVEFTRSAIRFTEFGEVQALINLLESRKIK